MSTLPTGVERPSLYDRLNGYDTVAAIVRSLFMRMKVDARFARFGEGRSADSQQATEQLTVLYVCWLAGGPCYYFGRDMTSAHRGLNITQDEWIASMDHTRAALQENAIPEQEQLEFLALFERYRREIVEA